jgi:thiol-disulfide isomerase/thioredoxin
MKILLSVFAIGCALVAGAQKLQEAPALKGSTWINSKAAEFKGHVTILHFWTFACINCKHNVPYYNRWASKYEGTEVQVIGVHTPELEIEKKLENVKNAVREYAIGYPVLFDGDFANWDQYKVDVWPTVILIDKQGRIRTTWKGELQWNGQDGFGTLTQKIERLRQEKG